MEDKSVGRNGFIDAGMVVLAGLLFFRTADVLTNFSPQYLDNLVGMNVAWLYAGLMAFWVEGMILAFHFDKRTKYYTRAKIAMWTLIGISALCQVYDGNISTDNLANMSDPLKLGFQYGVPLLPIFVFVLIAWVGGMPNMIGSGTRGWLARLQDKGIKSHLPDPKALWHGKNTEFSPDVVVRSNLDVEKEEIAPSPNGHKTGTANPTKRQP